jgi:transcriptional regulator with XRE-family HTH domain
MVAATLGARGWYPPGAVTERPPHELLTLNLRRLTEQSHMPLTVVADRSGIDRRELFEVLTGERDADVDWLFKLADGLGVRPSELVRDPDEDE